MSGLCRYKNILGKPNEGIHSIRIFNIAVVDVILTMILAYLIVRYTNKQSKQKYNYWVVLVILFIVAYLIHRLFCVKTSVNTAIDNWLSNGK